jgi:hypothetical protein
MPYPALFVDLMPSCFFHLLTGFIFQPEIIDYLNLKTSRIQLLHLLQNPPGARWMMTINMKMVGIRWNTTEEHIPR